MKRFLKPVFWCVILSLVAWFVVRAFEKADKSFTELEFSAAELNFGLIMLSGLVYIIGLLPCWWYWRRTLFAMQQNPPMVASLRAYYIGHLGKYVPGKALVVVLRTGLLRGKGVDSAVTAATVFVETLTMMAVGACLAALILAFRSESTFYVWIAVGLAVASVLPTLPPVFRRVLRSLKIGVATEGGTEAAAGVDYKLIATGWLAMIPCWLLFGLSMLITLAAMGPERIPAGVSISDLPYLVATVALAMVAGFLSLLPGGIGVRDLIVLELIALHPRFGADVAIISAVVLRMTWLLSELVVSGILYMSSLGSTSGPADGPSPQ